MLLRDVNVDRIEVASARVSEGEKDAVKMICRYARQMDALEKVEVLGFVDGNLSVDWIDDCGGKVINLLAKGSEKHCHAQLHKTVEEHIEDIKGTVDYALSKGMTVNLYLEDWSNGMKDSPEYVYAMLDSLRDAGIRRFMLPDTLGILNPLYVIEFMRKMIKRLVEGYSGISIAPNQPVIGENVFTQVAGVHADGDNKGNLYVNALIPERFGRKREYALGKNSGRANIAKNLEELGLELTPEQTKRVTKRITELGDRKEIVTPDDLPYIVSDVLKHDAPEDKVKLVSYMTSIAYGLKPLANVKVDINGKQFEANSTGDGQYDAFVKALRKIYKENLGRTFPILSNYSVTIPPGGRTDALVQTVITWRNGEKIIRTRGLDADQTEAAIKATFKMLNIFEESENAQKGVI